MRAEGPLKHMQRRRIIPDACSSLSPCMLQSEPSSEKKGSSRALLSIPAPVSITCPVNYLQIATYDIKGAGETMRDNDESAQRGCGLLNHVE